MDHPLKTAALAVAASTGDVDRAYRLHLDQHVPDGVRRIARGQLMDAHDELSRASGQRLGRAVHETRKALKRLRACLRLTRDEIGEQTYERENTAFRMAAGDLAAGRDAQVRLETLNALSRRFPSELPPRVIAELRARLEGEMASIHGEAGVSSALDALEEATARIPSWTVERDGFEALSPGLRRIYRRGRKRMRVARTDPTPENLHEWRKRVKDLWYASQIVREARPKRLRRVSKRAHKLSELLGDGHDLSVLREYVEVHPQCFDGRASREALLAIIDRRGGALRDEAFKRGRKLYERSPKRFVREIARGWSRRACDRPRPIAG